MFRVKVSPRRDSHFEPPAIRPSQGSRNCCIYSGFLRPLKPVRILAYVLEYKYSNNRGGVRVM